MDELKAPSLIISMPELLDPNFRRSVVLLIEHNEEGSFGLVLNRPTEIRIRDLCEDLETPWGGDPDMVAQSGGPVSTQQGFLLHGPVPDDVVVNSREIVPAVSMALDMDTFRTLCSRPPEDFRMILGYAGWSADQLEQEVAAGAWLTAAVDRNLVFGSSPEEMWQEALRKLGIDPAMLVTGTGVH